MSSKAVRQTSAEPFTAPAPYPWPSKISTLTSGLLQAAIRIFESDVAGSVPCVPSVDRALNISTRNCGFIELHPVRPK